MSRQPLTVDQNFVYLMLLQSIFRVFSLNSFVLESLNLFDWHDLKFDSRLGLIHKILEPELTCKPIWCTGGANSNLTLGEWESNDFDFPDLFHTFN